MRRGLVLLAMLLLPVPAHAAGTTSLGGPERPARAGGAMRMMRGVLGMGLGLLLLGGAEVAMAQAQAIEPSTATLVDWQVAPNGAIAITWSDGSGTVVNDLATLYEEIASLSTVDTAKLLLVAWFLARQPAGEVPNLVIGKTLTLDLAAPQPIRVQ